MHGDYVKLFGVDPAQLLTVLSIASVRTLVALAMLPLFSSSLVPTTVRAGLAMVTVYPVAMSQLDQPSPVDLTSWSLFAFVAKEAAVGLVIGLGFGAFFAGLQTAGEIIDHQTGLTFTQDIDPVHGNHTSLTSEFMERVLFTTLMASGAMLVVVDTLYLSYQVWPLGHWAPRFERAMLFDLVTHASRLFALSLLLAGPMLLVLFIVDAGMGLLNRAVPQLSVHNITTSLKSVIGLTVLMLALPMIIERVFVALREVAATLSAFLVGLR